MEGLVSPANPLRKPELLERFATSFAFSTTGETYRHHRHEVPADRRE
jgi:hypothetical protein